MVFDRYETESTNTASFYLLRSAEKMNYLKKSTNKRENHGIKRKMIP